jgi:hypothetical protein
LTVVLVVARRSLLGNARPSLLGNDSPLLLSLPGKFDEV